MQYLIDLIIGFATLFVIFGLPFMLSHRIATERNRDTAKALVVTLFFGWFGTVGMWLALKTRKRGRLI